MRARIASLLSVAFDLWPFRFPPHRGCPLGAARNAPLFRLFDFWAHRLPIQPAHGEILPQRHLVRIQTKALALQADAPGDFRKGEVLNEHAFDHLLDLGGVDATAQRTLPFDVLEAQGVAIGGFCGPAGGLSAASPITPSGAKRRRQTASR